MSFGTKNPLFSVGMCIYSGDQPAAVQLAIDSILAQTYKNYELIIHIDGTVDESINNIIESAAKKCLIIVVKSPNNIGLAAGLNKIIRVMNGEYFVRMDADDVSAPTRLEFFLNFFESNLGIDIAGSAMAEFEKWPNVGNKISYPVSHSEIRKLFLTRNPLCHASTVFRRRVFDSISGYPLISLRNEDTLLFLSAFNLGFVFANLNECLYYAKFNSAATLRRVTLRKAYSDFLDRLRVIFDLGGNFKNVVIAFGVLAVTVSPFYNTIRKLVLTRK